MHSPIYETLFDPHHKGAGFLWLIDPEKVDPSVPDPRWEMAEECGVTAFLVGTSQDGNGDLEPAIASLRRSTRLPLVLFPGSAAQVSAHVDAVLFLSLLSGRNPDYLVGEQVKGTPKIREYGIEPIPTGYILVDTGSAAQTSVAKRSQTQPLPEHDHKSICDHALCAQYMGHSAVYIEAGSGATRPIASSLVREVRNHIDIPLIVGGGMTSPEHCHAAVHAGANCVVVGTVLERDGSVGLLRELVSAAHLQHKTVNV